MKIKKNSSFFILQIIPFILMPFISVATNVSIDKAASITGINTTDKTAFITFDVSWENSWRTSTGSANYDGVWIYIKYKENSGTEWKHAHLSATASDYSVTGTNSTAAAFTPGSTDKKIPGVFAYRQKEGSGNINWDGVKIKWNYDADGIIDINNITVKVLAIEMVYVPAGAFSLGTGGTEASAFYKYPNITSPFVISSEAAITIGQKDGDLFYTKHYYAEPFLGTIPTEFPKGFKAFWCMKYELTQGQYVEYLNMLSRQQQNAHSWTDITGTKVTNRYILSNTATMQDRCGICCDSAISAANPVVFYCDMNGNGVPNEKDDGQNVSCNFLSWWDDASFSDWAGLRPMSELEFEKACRGPLAPVAEEYPWGSTFIKCTTSILNGGMITETPSNTDANAIFAENAVIMGPVRAGFFEKKNGTKVQNGTSYYGIADLGGNLFERVVSVSNKDGVIFKGSMGDGEPNAWATPLNADWPGILGIGSGFRGGSYFYGSPYCRTSDRQYSGVGDWQRFNHYGYRAVRTAE